MPAYWIGHSKVKDAEAYQKFADRAYAAMARHDGKILIRSADYKVLDGPDDYGRHLVAEFPSLEAAEACFNSEEYQEARADRIASDAGEVRVTIVFR